MSHTVATRFTLLALVALSVPPLAAQERSKGDANDNGSVLTKETYVRPSAEVERLVLAPRYLNVTLFS